MAFCNVELEKLVVRFKDLQREASLWHYREEKCGAIATLIGVMLGYM